jgi:lipoprotein-anchoring transpeptidase ErfK/SrfK
MSGPARPSRKGVFVVLALLIPACGTAAVTAWSFNSSLAKAETEAPSLAPAQAYAHVELPKPTYTASPSPQPSPTPTLPDPPTPTSQPSVYVEIVPDTPVPELSTSQLGPIEGPSSESRAGGWNKSILVDISEQHMYVYEGESLVQTFVASTGMNNATRTGHFEVISKIPNAYGETWNIWMPNWLGIYWVGGLQNGIHALPILPDGSQLWEGYLGTPISYGCVVLGAYEAQVLYDWAELGTSVEIRW